MASACLGSESGSRKEYAKCTKRHRIDFKADGLSGRGIALVAVTWAVAGLLGRFNGMLREFVCNTNWNLEEK